MISLEKYDGSFEATFFTKGKKLIDDKIKKKEELLDLIHTLFPANHQLKNLEDLILLRPNELEEIVVHLKSEGKMNEIIFTPETLKKERGKERKDTFQQYYEIYTSLRDSKIELTNKKKYKTAKALMKKQKMTVCPYCNRDYINSRSIEKTGVQLDHFYNRSEFPFFSISLYNLIPSCSNCNHMKDTKEIGFSPFSNICSSDQKIFHVNFDYNKNRFRADRSFQIIPDKTSYSTLETKLRSNFTVMGVREAYSIHEDEVMRLFYLSETYCDSQLEEHNRMIEKLPNGYTSTSFHDFHHVLYGFDLHNPDFKNQPLSKMRFDILKELGVIRGTLKDESNNINS